MARLAPCAVLVVWRSTRQNSDLKTNEFWQQWHNPNQPLSSWKMIWLISSPISFQFIIYLDDMLGSLAYSVDVDCAVTSRELRLDSITCILKKLLKVDGVHVLWKHKRRLFDNTGVRRKTRWLYRLKWKTNNMFFLDNVFYKTWKSNKMYDFLCQPSAIPALVTEVSIERDRRNHILKKLLVITPQNKRHHSSNIACWTIVNSI